MSDEYNSTDTINVPGTPDAEKTDMTTRNHDECAAIALKDRVLNSPGLLSLAPSADHWEVAISRAIDLFEEPRNISALWCWARFCWAFGKRDTWAANARFEELLKLIALMSDNAIKYELNQSNSAEQIELERNAKRLGEQLSALLGDLYQNDYTWNDRADFLAFKGRI